MGSNPVMTALAALTMVYAVVSAVLASYYLFVFWVVRRDSVKDERSGQAMRQMETIAESKGTTIWGIAVIAALKWPLVLAHNMRRGG